MTFALLSAPAAALKDAKPKEYDFFEHLRQGTANDDEKAVANPWSMQTAGAVVKEGLLGEIPIATVETMSGQPVHSPGPLRAEETNGTVSLSSRNKKLFFAEETMRNQWCKTKNGVLMKWLKTAAAQDPEKLVVLVENGDVVFGGCSGEQMRTYYEAIRDASGGAKVVASAEVSPYPSDMMPYYNRTFRADLEERMSKVSRALDVKENWAADYADCRDPLGGPCDSPPTYRFMNYGFVMGPAHALEKFVTEVYQAGGFDQMAAQTYFLKHPEEVTLDYTGNLALSLHNIAEDDESPLSIKKPLFGKKHLVNKVTGQTQCFVHGNGNSESFVRRLAKELM